MSSITLPGPIAFVFSGGAARSSAQVGMLRATLAAGLLPQLVVGSSTGALNAAATAISIDTAADVLERVWIDLGNDAKLTTVWRSAVRGIASTQGKRTGAILRKHLATALPDLSMADLSMADLSMADLSMDDAPLGLTLVATDLATGLATQCATGTVLDAVMACTALPVILPPTPHGDTYLIDGGVAANVPVTQAVEQGARSIVLFDTGASAVPDDQVEDVTWYDVMALAYSHMIRGQAAHDLARVAHEVPVVVVSYARGNPFDLTEVAAHIAAGEMTAESVLNKHRAIKRPGIYGPVIGLESDERLVSLYR